MQDSRGPTLELGYFMQVGLLAAIYFVTARISLLVAIPPGYATAVWPPSGMALAALLIFGFRLWPGIWLGAMLANYPVSSSPLAALVIGSGNTLEALLAAGILARCAGIPCNLARPKDVLTFAVAAVLSATIPSTIALAPLGLTYALSWRDLIVNWWTWWQGDVVGIIIVTPLILSWRAHGTVRWTRSKILEATGLAVLVVATAEFVLGGFSQFSYASETKFLLFPFVIWTAFQFGQREVNTVVAAIAVIAVRHAIGDVGTRLPEQLNEILLNLLAFNSTVAITGLALSAVVSERRRVLKELRGEHDMLENRVHERTLQLQEVNRALQEDIRTREKTERKFRALLEAAPDATVIANREGLIVLVNSQTEVLFGYPSAELVGQPVDMLLPTRHRGTHSGHRSGFFAEPMGRPMGADLDLYALRKDGTEFPVEISLSPLRTEDDELLVISAIRDITVRKGLDKVLQQNEERFRLMVSSVRDYAFYMLDPDGRIVNWNSGAERIKGYRAEEVIGRHLACFYPAEAVESGQPSRQLSIASTEGHFAGEQWQVRKDGTRFFASVLITAVRDPAGGLLGFSKITKDLTERKRAEDALVAAKLVAEQATRAKSTFLTKMSHELRTPLNSLMILARLLAENADHNLTAKQVEYARTIYSSGTDLLNHINDLLDLARIEAGASIKMNFAPVRLFDLQHDLDLLFRHVAKEKGLCFHIMIDSRLPATIETDNRRLLQILKNLLSNAFKFTLDGSVILRVAPAESRVAADRGAPAVVDPVAFSVTDTGLGIEQKNQEIIFEPFRQDEHVPSQQFGGTGLGLAISKELAQLLGGEIRVQSVPSEGSTFTVYLPLVRKPTPLSAALYATPANLIAGRNDDGENRV